MNENTHKVTGIASRAGIGRLAVHHEAACRNASERERKSASPGALAASIRKARTTEERRTTERKKGKAKKAVRSFSRA